MTSTVSETATQREMDSLRTGGEEMSRVHPLNRKQRLGGFESISTEVLPPTEPPSPPWLCTREEAAELHRSRWIRGCGERLLDF